MTQQQWLESLLSQGFHRMGQIEIRRAADDSDSFWLCHEDDQEILSNPTSVPEHFHVTENPYDAREISTYSADQEYRFTKGQTNLRGGWLMKVKGTAPLLAALDAFYPACFGLWVAEKRGTLEVQTLRDKLNRQTGMYRFARSISDEGAQALVQQVCGPAHQCAKKILWKIDENTPLDDSEASRFNGISSGLAEPHAIPLLCREACNHFVAECRKASKREFEAKAAASS
jgi:sirohydrochlorin cobaltochelatase